MLARRREANVIEPLNAKNLRTDARESPLFLLGGEGSPQLQDFSFGSGGVATGPP